MLLGFTVWLCYPMNYLITCLKKLSLIRNNNEVRYKDSRFEPFIKHKVLSPMALVGKNLLIIGDVHGCYDEMQEIINAAKQKSSKPLFMICVGDMLRKGPKNIEVIQYLMAADNILCVRGNHEQSILKKLYDINHIFSNEDTWIKDLTARGIEFLSDLPYTISIPDLSIVVVHAGLVPGIDLHLQNTNSMLNMRNLEWQEDIFHGHALKPVSNGKVGVPWASTWCGPQHVYFGHDAIRKLQLYEHATGLDSGCVYGGSLTSILLHLSFNNDGKMTITSEELISVNSFDIYRAT